MVQSRFYIWWVEAWGGRRIWTIRDHEPERKTHPKLPDNIKTETAARRICNRMNADWNRFLERWNT